MGFLALRGGRGVRWDCIVEPERAAARLRTPGAEGRTGGGCRRPGRLGRDCRPRRGARGCGGAQAFAVTEVSAAGGLGRRRSRRRRRRPAAAAGGGRWRGQDAAGDQGVLEGDGALHVRAAVVDGLGHRQQLVVDGAGGRVVLGLAGLDELDQQLGGDVAVADEQAVDVEDVCSRYSSWQERICRSGYSRRRTGISVSQRRMFRTPFLVQNTPPGRRSPAGCPGCRWPWCCPGTGTGSAAARLLRRSGGSGPAGRPSW